MLAHRQDSNPYPLELHSFTNELDKKTPQHGEEENLRQLKEEGQESVLGEPVSLLVTESLGEFCEILNGRDCKWQGFTDSSCVHKLLP